MEAGVWRNWQEATTKIASFMFACAMFQQFFPEFLRRYLETLKDKFVSYFFPCVQISFHEYSGSKHKISEAYSLIESYLSSKSPTHSKRIIGDLVKRRESVVLTMDASEEIVDVFDGVVVKWFLRVILPISPTISWRPNDTEKKCYELTFHSKDRKVITSRYLDYVMSEGREIAVRNRQQRIYTNNPSDNWWDYKKNMWSHAVFKHPTTFKSLALDPKFKDEITDDLLTFSKGKEYYEKAGKPWKRGYLLYGPPGTGKSTMIAAMANYLNYDIYDLELTAVRDNTELRKLASVIPSKSIVVIEDIDCSLDISGRRGKKKENEIRDSDPVVRKLKEEQGQGGRESKVTLSGLLNFMDGLWSACAGERIIVVTTNYVKKLDPALIRRGRMDRHIDLSYCGFEAFKVLAKNFLDIDTHDLFETIRKLLEETKMTPADVAESLMPKTLTRDVETCLQNLIRSLNNAKEAKTCGGEENGCEKEDETSEGEEEGSKKDDESCESEEGGEKEDSSCYSLSSAG